MPDSKNSSAKENKHHVLIVDDDREIAETLRYALTNEGFQVSVAADGNQGVAYVEAKNPDLVILDMMMPRRSGFLVLERLRQVTDEPVKVIMITGNEGARQRVCRDAWGQ